MRKKRRQQLIAMLLTVVMLVQTIGSVAFAQTPTIEGEVAEVQTEAGSESSEEAKSDLVLPERVMSWSEDYETAASQEEADALRNQKEDVNLLITAKECELSGLKYGEIVSTSCERLDLSEMTAKLLNVTGSAEIQLKGTELEQLILHAEEGECISLYADTDTKIPEIILEGSGDVVIEGNASLGMVRVSEAREKLTVRATCSVLNESGQSLKLEKPDGNSEELQAGQQKELVLSSYIITFMADGEVYQTLTLKPGETITYPETSPEKEGSIFTTWYKDEDYTEACSQFDVAEKEATLYARFVDEADAVTITFDTMGGRKLEPQILAKGESLLTRSVSEIYTEKEGYTFGGWCKDKECTEAISYSEPLEESQTLYAYFVSNEVQEIEKDGTSVDLKDFDWQDKIALRADTKMSPEEVMENVKVEPGTGALEPELELEETEDGYLLYGSYYEKDGETGLEPGATFSVILSGGVHFADYPDETDTAVVSVYKERVEIVGFSEDISYVLWDDVLEYTPVVALEDNDLSAEEEMMPEEETETETESEIEAETDQEGENEQESETEAFRTEGVADADGESAQEWEDAPYIPGELLVKSGTSYQVGDIVAFYDGEIGRDEKSIDAYTEGSRDGYVLFAQILSAEETGDGILLTYGYANPEDYLADFDVHVTDDVNLEEQLSDEDLEVLASRLSKQVEENEELKAQMLVAVMSAPETQDMLDDMYGEGVYSLAAMTATLTPGKPTIKLSVSGSGVSATISIAATATIRNNGKVMLQIQPKLSFTQALSVSTNVDGGKVWIDMAVTIRSTTKIELTVTATTGGKFNVFSKAEDALSEIVKPEGIVDGAYETVDSSVADLMDTMNSIVSTSLKYNDIFDVLLLNLKYSFYGIITVGFEVHLVGQIGVLATFGVEIVAKSGERIGFKYDFLKFKGSSYTEKLESSVTNNIYLIGKVGVRVGLRLILSVTLCGIATASISGSLYAYAELSGLFFNTTNLLTGANTNLGALKFEVGIDVVVALGLKVNLIIKTIRKNWTVYTGRWPLWSKTVSSKLSYVDEDKLKEQWKSQEAKADNRGYFGFEYIPMKTWDLMSGKCTENQILCAKNSNFKLSVKNLVVNGEPVEEGSPAYGLFKVGDASKKQNPAYLYMDETVAAELLCETAELDLVLTYENNSSSALVKKQEVTFHLKKKCSLATTTHNVKVVLNDWCARAWGLETAAWDNTVVYETSFSTSHLLGSVYEPTATGTLNLGEVLSSAQSLYPEIREYTCQWQDPSEEGAVMQYSVPRVSNFCYMTPSNGVVRYDVYPGTDSCDVTYYLYVRRFEGNDDAIRYHIRINDRYEEDSYEFRVKPTSYDKELTFTEEEDGSYLLEARRRQFNGTDRPLMMSVNGEEAAKTGFSLNGREYQQDVYFDLTLGNSMLGIQLGNGVTGYQMIQPEALTEEGIKAGTKVELQVELAEGYGGLEVLCENTNVDFKVEGNVVTFVMPGQDLAITLNAYKLYSITYMYQYGGYGVYDTAYFTEKEATKKIKDPEIEGLTFRGWYTSPDASGEPYEFGKTLETDITLYADWTCDVTVYFSPAKGKAAYLTGDENQMEEHLIFEGDTTEYYKFTYSTLRVGEKLLNIQIPEYEGYQFMDWYTDSKWTSEPVNLETYEVTGGVELYARWAKMLTVSFDTNDGSEKTEWEEITAYSGYPLPLLPEEPQRECYTFTGWYRNHAATQLFDTATEIINNNLTLYAGWKADEYTITYDLRGGVNAESNPASYTIEDSFSLAKPKREGYTFKGWTETGLEEDCSKNVTVEAGSTGDRTYTAVWEPIAYTISYSRIYDEATKVYPDSYDIEKEITLPTPERDGYKFGGWIGTGLEQAQQTVVIPKGSMGDRTYTATWSTGDPIKSILEKVGVLANQSPYEKKLSVCLPADTNINGTIDYTSVKKSLENEVVAHVNKLIEYSKDLSAYSNNLSISAAVTSEDRTSDGKKQNYKVTLTVVFTDDDNVTTTETFKDCPAYLSKLTVDCTWPTHSTIKLNETVANSTFSEDGTATYGEQSVSVAGTFDWKESEKEKVPFGRNNGTDAGKYTAVFTPELSDRYAVTETKLPVNTQTLLFASGTADNRDFLWDETAKKASTAATGTLKLVYADEAGKSTEEEFTEVEGLLTGGSWSFVDGNVGTEKTVTCTGYTWNSDMNSNSTYGTNAYILANPAPASFTTLANINQVGQRNSNISTTAPVAASNTYGKQLGEIALNGGSVTYYSVPVEGSWGWMEASHTIPDVGSSHAAVFTPAEKYNGGFANMVFNVYSNLSYKNVYIPELQPVKYTGEPLAAFAQTKYDDYYVKENVVKTDAGSYPVTLVLNDKLNCRWYEEQSNGGVNITTYDQTLQFVIEKAKPTITKIGKVTSIPYGQKLTSGDTKQEMVAGVAGITTRVSAKALVEGYTVSYGLDAQYEPAGGTWTWVTDTSAELLTEKNGEEISQVTQPLSAGTHLIKAKYTPNGNADNLETLETYLEVKVSQGSVVERGPYYVTATRIYKPSTASENENALSSSILMASGKLYNQYTGEVVSGHWEWDKPDIIPPNEGGTYGVHFIPDDLINYQAQLKIPSCSSRTVEVGNMIYKIGTIKGSQLVGETEKTWTQNVNTDWTSQERDANQLVLGSGIINKWEGEWTNLLLEEFKMTWSDNNIAKSVTIQPNDGSNDTFEDSGKNIQVKVDRDKKQILVIFLNGITTATDNFRFEIKVKDATLDEQSTSTLSTAEAQEMQSMPETELQSGPESETQAPETESETQAPETSAPEKEAQTSATETTTSETTVPETESDTSAPETNAPETSAPETSAPETNAPETTAPETTAPETSAPETSAPAETEAQVSPQSETSAPATEAQTSAPETDPPASEADEAA